MYQGLQHSLMAHGMSQATAARQSYVALFGMVQRQATILSFLDVFRLLGLIFLLLAPLVLLMKRPPGGSGNVAVH
jgi:DHA2 family multidrug resistance protein